MAQIDLSNYETVEERIRRFYRDNPEARITTDLVAFDGEAGRTRWIVKAFVFKDSEREKPDSTGYAFEIDGAGMTQKAAALETCETSAIGRALANLNYSGNKRDSREEIAKVQAHQPVANQPAWKPSQDFLALIKSATTGDEKNAIWQQAVADNAPQAYLDELKKAGS